MRELRFRGKTTTNGMWIAGFYACIPDGIYGPDRHWIGIKKCEGRFPTMLQVDPETVGQFTGKLDKNGKKIFEGDIVKTKYGRLCVVCWRSSIGLACWDLDPVNMRENIRNTCAPNDYDLWVSKNLEVVGNIHDNPEMLINNPSIDVLKGEETMSNEKMKVGLSFNGKSVEVELTQEQLKELGLIEEKKKTGYERVEPYKDYWTVMSNGDVMPWVDSCTCGVDRIYEQADYYSDRIIAENNARVDKLMRQLRRFAAENGGIPSKEDWEKRDIPKYVIEYNHSIKKIDISPWFFKQMPGVVYFKSKEACKKAIEEFKDELLWYFTEYQAMLY